MNGTTNRTGIRPAGAWVRALCVMCSLVIAIGGAFAATPVQKDTADQGPSLHLATVQSDFSQASPNPQAPDAGCAILALPTDGGTSGNERAPNSNFRFGRAVYLLTAAEMATAGISSGTGIAGIGWHHSTAGISATGPLVVYLQNTADTTNTKSTTWATAISGMTTVHNASTNIPASTTPFNITFSGGSAFTYTGGGLYVAFDWQWAGPSGTTAIVACNTTLPLGLLGANGTTSAPTAIAASNFRPETRFLPTVGVAIDIGVDLVYSMGAWSIPLGGSQTIKAIVTNHGTSPQSNVNVTLNIAGANTFSNVQTTGILTGCGGTQTMTFAAFTPIAVGADTVTVSVPADQANSNNSSSHPLNETPGYIDYKYPGSTAQGGVGLTGGTGVFVGKFTVNAATSVTAVNLEFFAASATTYRAAIYNDSGSGTPGTTVLYADAVDRTVSAPGPVTITLPLPLAVGPGNFYVGVQQTNTTNASYSFDNESPIRANQFYFSGTLPAATWNEFGANALAFKLNIGVTLDVQCITAADCNDNNACTDDSCSNLHCVHTPNSATECDNNPCTSPDICSSGTCIPGPNPCNDNNACTQDLCGGGCSNPPINCDDNNPCTDDSCNPQTGCVHVNNTLPCTDNNVCTVGDACSGGVCVPGPLPQVVQFCSQDAIIINDSVAPTLASPYPASINISGLSTYLCSMTVDLNGLSHTFPDDIDILLAHQGGPNAIIMSDVGGSDSTGGSYNLNLDDAAATFLPDAGPLVSGTFKPTNDVGTGTEAWPAPAPAPLGGSALSVFNGLDPNGTWNLFVVDDEAGDSGVISNGWCINVRVLTHCTQNTDCNDNNACTSDTCVSGQCVVLPISCDDSNACTDDFCDQTLGCQHANNTESCDDGNACTQGDACSNGACTGTAVVCNDFNACTLDSCNPGTGCVFTDNSAACNDNNPCTNDSCNPGSGCVHANNTNACDDGNACTSGDVCSGGSCTGTPVPPPAEVSGVAVAADKATYSWSATPGATGYDVVRGRIGALPVGPGGGDEVPFCGLAGNSVVDASATAPGDALFYISRAKNACGNGTYGTQSNLTPRVTTTCP